MATQKDLEYYLAQFRRIAEHREKGAMRKIWTEYKELLKDLKHFLADYYAEYAIDDELTFEILNGKSRRIGLTCTCSGNQNGSVFALLY